MGNMTWGLLGRELIGSKRRTRTLGLGAAVRNFNEIAVPGMGGVWFARQLYLATLGVAVNQLARQSGAHTSNIEVTNALEAMGCWHAFRKADRQDARVRGREKLPRDLADLSFSRFGRPSFYVTQPMRMQTVQAIRELGLVESPGERFNSYRMTAAGQEFLNAAFGDLPMPYKRPHLAALAEWVCGRNQNMETDAIRQLLSPVEPLSKAACERLLDLLVRGGSEDATRRRNLLAWCDELQQGKLQLAERPQQLDPTHWHDVQAGRLFFVLQSAAFAVLDAVEAMLARTVPHVAALNSLNQPPVLHALAALRLAAATYLKHGYVDRTKTGAGIFADECAELSNDKLIASLVTRDGRVLRLRGREVIAGEAFSCSAEIAENQDEGQQPPIEGDVPPGLSYRINNLYLLSLDLKGELAFKLERQLEDHHE